MSSLATSSAHGITFQKCAVVGTDQEPESANVKLLINNTNTRHAINVTDLVLLDNITGLRVQGTKGNRTADGFQTFRIQFLHVGEHCSLEYIAVIDATKAGEAGVLILPAKLTFRSVLNDSEFEPLTASLRITGEKKTKALLSHGTHALGFFTAFIISFVLTSVTLWTVYTTRRVLRERQETEQDRDAENKQERSRFNSGGTSHEDILLNDHIIDILCFEESENMQQSLEDFGIADLTHADRDLEACRMQISREVIALLTKNMIAAHGLSPHVEKRMNSAFRKQFLAMEMEIQEEYSRKMVALTAECSLENRKAAETQHRRERADSAETEELVKKANEKSAAECRALLGKLHRLEQLHRKRFLLVKQEEYFAAAYRELAVTERSEVHSIFFTQMKNMVSKGELGSEAAKSLIDNYCKTQGEIEERMDCLQAHKKYHLSKRFAHREHLVQMIQLLDSHWTSLWDLAADKIQIFIRKVERGCHLAENHLGGVLDRAQGELRSAQQEFVHVVKEEKQKLHRDLLAERCRGMLQKKEEQQAQIGPEEISGSPEDVCRNYLAQWQRVLADRWAEFEELAEKLDREAKDELVALGRRLTERASKEIRRVHCGPVLDELLKLSLPKPFLHQTLEDHQRELTEAGRRVEKDVGGKIAAAEKSLQSKREKLNAELLDDIREQRKLRNWEQLVLLKLSGSPLSLSEEEILKVKQEFHVCFSQMDRSLALPRVRAKALLQVYQSERREAALQKLDPKGQTPSQQQEPEVGRKTRNRNKIDALKKSLEKKIHIYEESVIEQYEKKILSELQQERTRHLQTLENKIGQCLASLQFQRTAPISETLEFYTAVIRLRSLLLEQLRTSEALLDSDCVEVVGRSSREIEELEKKMEDELSHHELARKQPYPMNGKTQSPDPLGIANSTEELHPDGPTSVLLQQALTECNQLLSLHRQSLREAQNNLAVLENSLENVELDTLLELYDKELRLASYLTKLTPVPTGTLQRLLHLLLPTRSQNELLSVLASIADKHADAISERDSSKEEPGSCQKRRHQQSWKAFETKWRQEMISDCMGDRSSVSCDQSRLKQLMLLGTATFLHPERFPEETEPSSAEAAGAAEIIELSGTNEKVFVFRDSALYADSPSKKKKKASYLNSKKLGLLKTDT